jgi:S-adenosylmethionine hydrolase
MPVLTLTTDIGLDDYIIGAIKGQVLSVQPTCSIVDISHQLSPFNLLQAAYICSSAYKHFPAGSFHIILVNLFDNENKQLLIAKHGDQFIGCPDNGILTLIMGYKPEQVVAIPIGKENTLGITEHLIYAFNRLEQHVMFEHIGVEPITILERYPLRSMIGTDWIEGQILHIDRFENVVVNITETEFEEQRKGRKFKITFTRNEMITGLSNNYGSVLPGEKMAWFNSAGYLEIAINRGNMAGMFGLQGYSEAMHQQSAAMQNKWMYQTVRIFFE